MTASRSGSSFLLVSSLHFLLILAIPARAQKDTGSIVGTVKDPSGAIVANAKVTITDLEHGQTSRQRPTRRANSLLAHCELDATP